MNDSEQVHTHDEFREHVIEKLAIIETSNAGMLEQLKRMNGTQAVLVNRMTEAELKIATIHVECPVQSKVELLEQIVGRRRAEDYTRSEVNKKWLEWAKPLLMVVGGAFGMMLLSHIDTWISLIKK
jgi:hypothetical protein